MGLIGWVHSQAASSPHVLLVEEPGGTAPRLALERALRERGWPLVDSPADADVLAVVGDGTALEEFVGRIWEQLPGPRIQLAVKVPEDAAQNLDRAQESLQDIAAQRLDAATRRPPGQDNDVPGHPMPGHEMGGEHDGHGDGQHMAAPETPAGLPMADRAPDRDGLLLDVLRVPWGPALSWWPAGLILTSKMHGDVLTEVEVSRIGPPEPAAAYWRDAAAEFGPARAGVAGRLDSLSRLLAVAGWDAERIRAQRIRDELLTGEPDGDLLSRLERLARRIGSSRTLAWMTGGIGVVKGADVTSRYRSWLTESVEAVRSDTAPPDNVLTDQPLDVLTRLVRGIELSAIRLVVASLDPWLTGALPHVGVHRG